MILIGLGANLTAPGFATVHEGCMAAIHRLGELGVEVEAQSRWYESAPVPHADQPWYLNAVLAVRWGESAAALMHRLHSVEAEFGRNRPASPQHPARDADSDVQEGPVARTLDLDLLDFNGELRPAPHWPVMPHPRVATRAFVLLPLRDICPDWCHPESGASLTALIEALPPDQGIRLWHPNPPPR